MEANLCKGGGGGNQVAHLFAQYVVKQTQDCEWRDVPPECIRETRAFCSSSLILDEKYIFLSKKRLDTLSLPLSCLFPELSVKFTKEH
jgi:hypothetical protein